MKAIFDAIRKHFAHKPHGFRESHPQRKALAHLERTLRGFSNKLETLTGATPLKGKDLALQLKLREALVRTLCQLHAHQSSIEVGAEANTPSLDLAKLLSTKDETGYLCATALTLIRNACRFDTQGMREGMTLYAELGPLAYTPGKLSFCIEIKVELHTADKPRSYQEGPFFLEDADLDSLGGAARAFHQIEGTIWKCLADAPRSVRYQATREAILSDSQETQHRDERIRAAFKGLPAMDRQHLVTLSRQTPLSGYFA